MESGGAPGERDMSELAPSIVLREGKPLLVIGGAGRERIPSAVLQVMINVIDRQMTLERAVLSPRVFLTKDTLRIHDAFPPEVMQPLSERFSIEKVELGAVMHLGLVHAVRYDPETGEFFGAADLGDSGSAMAPAGSEQRKR
jgi:gamma-glutamyltranspeptidase/glutathione hydrolase